MRCCLACLSSFVLCPYLSSKCVYIMKNLIEKLRNFLPVLLCSLVLFVLQGFSPKKTVVLFFSFIVTFLQCCLCNVFNIVLKSWIKGGSHLSTQLYLSHIPIIIIVVTLSSLSFSLLLSPPSHLSIVSTLSKGKWSCPLMMMIPSCSFEPIYFPSIFHSPHKSL